MTTNAVERGWIPTASDFGARLALVRQHMGWGNVQEAALACGLPVSSWRNWERDNRQPRDYMGACRAIADRAGCDLGWLAGIPSGPGVTAGAASDEDRHRQSMSVATGRNLRFGEQPNPDLASAA